MTNFTIIGIDLAKTKLHIAALDENRKVAFKKAIVF
jgi:predicted NBD/HSP70 family sugar kinase